MPFAVDDKRVIKVLRQEKRYSSRRFSFANMCYIVSCRNYLLTKLFNNCKNVSTDGEVILKIKVAHFFLGHRVFPPWINQHTDVCSDDVNKAFRKLSVLLHPDKSDAPGSEEAFKILVAARSCLLKLTNRWLNFDLGGHDLWPGLITSPFLGVFSGCRPRVAIPKVKIPRVGVTVRDRDSVLHCTVVRSSMFGQWDSKCQTPLHGHRLPTCCTTPPTVTGTVRKRSESLLSQGPIAI